MFETDPTAQVGERAERVKTHGEFAPAVQTITSSDLAGATIEVEELAGAKRRVSVQMPNGTHHACETEYPAELIESILRAHGPNWLCDEIRRDEDPQYVQRALTYAILAYVDEGALVGKRLLDFGCGSGASSFVLRRMFPETEIVGVELIPEYVDVARERARFYGARAVTFERSPSGESLPEAIGDFDFVVLSAVYEHLLPQERRSLLPTIWSHVRPEGILFINQLPYRYSPMELHTTGLPLINYLPDRWTYTLARRFSKRLPKDETWEDYLRRGIRGGSPRQIRSILNGTAAGAILLQPCRLGLKDAIELWHALSSGSRWPAAKTALKGGFRAMKWITGAEIVPYLSLAIKKTEET